MRTFGQNMGSYHSRNALNEIYNMEIGLRAKGIKTREEFDALMGEIVAHYNKEGEEYHTLGDEMAKIMSKKWWEFWK